MNHAEFLAEAQNLYDELAVREKELEQTVVALTEKTVAQAQEIAALKAEIVVLKARIKQLEDQLNPPTTQPTTQPLTTPPPQLWLWNDDFATVPTDARYIRSGADPDQNFKLIAPGRLKISFVAGKKDANGKPILRSELLPRVPGTNLSMRLDIGKSYVMEYGATIPADYNPGVSSKPNEKRNTAQLHQRSGDPPPIAVELIKPDGSPWNGTQNIFRLVVLGVVKWWANATLGRRYDWSLKVGLSAGADGKITLGYTENGVVKPGFVFVGQTAYQPDLAASPPEPKSVAPHLGLYLPASADDPVGGKTDLEFHHLRIRLA